MFYPNGKKYTKKNEYINYKNRGMNLESLINDANLYYLENNKAVIYKRPTPIGLVDVDYKKGEIKKAYFKEKSTFDYNGIYKGKYIDFEAKESKSKTSFPLSNIHKHQINHLRNILNHGAISFLIVSISDAYYLLKGEDLLFFIENNDRKSIPISFFEKHAKKINLKIRPILDYLEMVDEIYFKERGIKNGKN